MHSSGHCNHSHVLPLLAGAIMGIFFAAVQSPSQNSDPESVLRKRVISYFEAWRQGDWEKVATFVHPDSRKLYIYRIPRSAPITAFRIEKLVFNPGKTLCEVKAVIARPNPIVPEYSGTPSFPLDNQWMLAPDGEWYLLVPFQQDALQKVFQDSAKGADVAKAATASSANANTAAQPAPLPSWFQADPANPSVLHRGEKGTFKFSYRNSGTAPMKIASAYADCHCTSVQGEHTLLAPGESGVLEVVLDTFGLPLGAIQKKVVVAFSDSRNPVVIDLRVKNLPNFTVEPASVDFGTMTKGKPVERTVRIINESGRPVKFLANSKTERQVTVLMDKKEAGPGEAVTITMRCDPLAPGDFLDVLILRVDLVAEPLINISVHGKVIS